MGLLDVSVDIVLHWSWNKLYFNSTSFILHCCLSAFVCSLLTYLLSGSTQAACNFTRTQFLDLRNFYCSIQLVFGASSIISLLLRRLLYEAQTYVCYT